MRKVLASKSLWIAVLALLLLIPLAMIQGLIEARNARQIEVVQEVAQLSAGEQTLVGPLLVVAYHEEVVVREINPKTGEAVDSIRVEAKQHVVVPHSMTMSSEARVDERHRGIFKAQGYEIDANLKGEFRLAPGMGVQAERKIQFKNAYLVLGLTDLRGIRQPPELVWQGQAHHFQAGGVLRELHSGVHVDLGPAEALDGQAVAWQLGLALKGSQSFAVAPVAESTKVTMRSTWPTPSFQGRFAAQHSEDERGFEATWEVYHLSRNLERILQEGNQTGETFGLAFLSGVNVYLQSERAVKYGFLFVGLVFGAFYFYEVLRRLPIHPISYLLVGLALAIFFLLLLSLAEHLPFAVAYVVASSACTGLIGAYLVHVLQSYARGWTFAGALAALFALLYFLLSSEDNALLMGSLALFGGLAVFMLATRRINWYAMIDGDPRSPM